MVNQKSGTKDFFSSLPLLPLNVRWLFEEKQKRKANKTKKKKRIRIQKGAKKGSEKKWICKRRERIKNMKNKPIWEFT